MNFKNIINRMKGASTRASCFGAPPVFTPGVRRGAPNLSEADSREVARLMSEMESGGEAKPGQARLMGWDIEYADAGAMLSCIELLVLNRWNDFSTDNIRPRIIDCGANIGISVLNYKRQFPDASILAFEPDPNLASILRRNLQKNQAGDVEVVEAAVWTEEGVKDFFVEGKDGGRLVNDQQEFPHTQPVKTVDLAEYLTKEVDLLKMDIEGGEFELISHLAGKLAVVKNLIVECHLMSRDLAPLGRLLETIGSEGFHTGVNSYGAWRDLISKSKSMAFFFDQYMLVAAWREDQPSQTA